MNTLASVARPMLLLHWRLAGFAQLLLFQYSHRNPQKTQHRTLLRILYKHRDSQLGRRLGFDSIASVDEFRTCVPIHTYEDLQPHLETLRPELYVQTSGTTGAPKVIPVSKQTLESYRRFQAINAYCQQRVAPGIFAGVVLEIVSSTIEGFTINGLPFGSMSGLFSDCLPPFVRRRRLLPRDLFSIRDYEQRYLLIAAIALSYEDITCIASANPSTLLKLIEVINSNKTVLLQYLSSGNVDYLGIPIPCPLRSILTERKISSTRTAALQTLTLNRGDLKLSDLWPNLRAIVTWTRGNCALFITKLRAHLSSDVDILEVGYLASEVWGTVMLDPLQGFGFPTIQDVFFEYIDPASWESGLRETLLQHELEDGKRYHIIVTTIDGLFRYFMNDLIEVRRIGPGSPTIAFLQKGKGVTNLTGEKLYEEQVVAAVDHVSRKLKVLPPQFMVLADARAIAYVCYIETADRIDRESYALALDQTLTSMNIEYAAKRASGRLGRLQVKIIRTGTFEELKKSRLKDGVREGQFKHVLLSYAYELDFPFHEFELQ